MNSKSYQKNQKCRPQCEQPPAARYQPGTITGLMSTEKPPDMQIGLASIYCPAECQFFPMKGWLGSQLRDPRCRIQLFGWETATGSPTTQWQAHSWPAARNHEHQHHDHHLEPHGNFRQVMICLDAHVDECRCIAEYFCWRILRLLVAFGRLLQERLL